MNREVRVFQMLSLYCATSIEIQHLSALEDSQRLNIFELQLPHLLTSAASLVELQLTNLPIELVKKAKAIPALLADFNCTGLFADFDLTGRTKKTIVPRQPL